jgi:RHH-type proline utilization regulon transcriptional repressor/proline dehydrogenase/delta 1-pyrroline-5-carboxylate dehydrogenase
MELVLRRYHRDFERHFAHARDALPIAGQDNLLRYLPAKLGVCVVSTAELSETDAAILRDVSFALAAHWVSGSELCLLAPKGVVVPSWLRTLALAAEVPLWTIEVETFVRTVRPDRMLHLGGEPTPAHCELFAAHHVHVTDRSPIPSGRLELLLHLKEQSLSITYHRYGHLGLHELQGEAHRAA